MTASTVHDQAIAGKLQLSQHGLRFIQTWEGYRGRPYQDSVGVWTIGYGHTEGVTAESPEITIAQAARLLETDVDATYGRAVNEHRFPFEFIHQFDMTVSFVYNLGVGMLDPEHTFGAHMAAHAFGEAAESMLMYDMAGGRRLAGLTARRKAECQIMLHGYPRGA